VGKVDYLEWLSARGRGERGGATSNLIWTSLVQKFPKKETCRNPAVLTLESTSSSVSRFSIYNKVGSRYKPKIVEKKTHVNASSLFR
jgi:hypothetical protein